MSVAVLAMAILGILPSQTGLLEQKVSIDLKDRPILDAVSELLKSKGIPYEMRSQAPGAKLSQNRAYTGSFANQPLAYVLERLFAETEPALFFREFEGKVIVAPDRYVNIDPRNGTGREAPTVRDILEMIAAQGRVKFEYQVLPYSKATRNEFKDIPFHRALRMVLNDIGGGYVRNPAGSDFDYTICKSGTLDRHLIGDLFKVAAAPKLIVGTGPGSTIANELSADKAAVYSLTSSSLSLYSAYDGIRIGPSIPVAGAKAMRVGARGVAVHQDGVVTVYAPSLSGQPASIPIQREDQVDFGFVANLLYVKDSQRGRLAFGSGAGWNEITGIEAEFGGDEYSFLPLPKAQIVVLQGATNWVAYSGITGNRLWSIPAIPGDWLGESAAGGVWTDPAYVKGKVTALEIKWLTNSGGSVANLRWTPSAGETYAGSAMSPDGSALLCFATRTGRGKPQLATYRIAPGKPSGTPTLKEFSRLSQANQAARAALSVTATPSSESKLVSATLNAVAAQIVNRVMPAELAPMPKSSRLLYRFNHDQLDWFDPTTGGRMDTPIQLRPKWGDRVGRFDSGTQLWIAQDVGPTQYERHFAEQTQPKAPVSSALYQNRVILLARERARLVVYEVDVENSLGKGEGMCYPIHQCPVSGNILAIADNGTRIVTEITPKGKAGQPAPERVFQVINTQSQFKTYGINFHEEDIVGPNGKLGQRIDVALDPNGIQIAFRHSEGTVIYLVDGTQAGKTIPGDPAKSSTGYFKFDRTGRYLITALPQGVPAERPMIIADTDGKGYAQLPGFMAIGNKQGTAFAVVSDRGIAVFRPQVGFQPNSMRPIPRGESVVAAEFSDNDRYLYLSTSDGNIQVWKAEPFAPCVSFVPLSGGNFVTFTDSYEYMASRGGAQAISFQAGAEQVSFDSFDLALNRPDRILANLGSVSGDVLLRYQKAREERVKSYWAEALQGADPDTRGEITVPKIKTNIVGSLVETSNRDFDLAFDASDEKADIVRVDVYVNGVPVFGRSGFVPDKAETHVEHTERIRLSDDINVIEVAATNRKGRRSPTLQTRVLCNAAPNSPHLYLIAIGTPVYDHMDNLPGASIDVKNIVDFFQKSANLGIPADRTHILSFVSGLDSRAQIRQMRDLVSKATEDDLVVFFYAGHGANPPTGLYFPFRSFDNDTSPRVPENENSPLLHISDIDSLMADTKARQKLVMIDSCQSGEYGSEESQTFNETPSQPAPAVAGRKARGAFGMRNASVSTVIEIMKSSFNDLRRGTGAITLASAGAKQAADEDGRGGVFSQAVIRGLKGAADINGDKRVTVNELYEFVTVEVVVQSEGKQRPTTRSENIRNNFVLSKLK